MGSRAICQIWRKTSPGNNNRILFLKSLLGGLFVGKECKGRRRHFHCSSPPPRCLWNGMGVLDARYCLSVWLFFGQRPEIGGRGG